MRGKPFNLFTNRNSNGVFPRKKSCLIMWLSYFWRYMEIPFGKSLFCLLQRINQIKEDKMLILFVDLWVTYQSKVAETLVESRSNCIHFTGWPCWQRFGYGIAWTPSHNRCSLDYKWESGYTPDCNAAPLCLVSPNPFLRRGGGFGSVDSWVGWRSGPHDPDADCSSSVENEPGSSTSRPLHAIASKHKLYQVNL